MAGMGYMAPPPVPQKPRKRIVMHMEFFWGTVTEVLFNDWPGIQGTEQYIPSLIFVFFLSLLLEWVSRLKIGSSCDHGRVATGILRTSVYTVRVGLAYLVMLAIMSFNGGVFLMIVAGHVVGFLIFRESVFGKSDVGKRTEKGNTVRFLIFREGVFGKSGVGKGTEKGNSDLNGLHC